VSAPVALQRVSTTCVIALIALALAWELWLAPLRLGGSWLALKALPLCAAVGGIARGRVYTYRWSTMLALAYFAEGLVRAYSERGTVRTLALCEIALSVAFFVAAIAYVRTVRKSQR
jgi:uncharacterized membrane protein